MRAVRGCEYKKKLVGYLKKNVKKGYTMESLKWALVTQGYSRSMVEEAIRQANQELAERLPAWRRQ